MIKNVIFSLIIIFTLTSCSFVEDDLKQKTEIIQEPTIQDYVDPYIDENPISLGLYLNEHGNKSLITSYASPLNQYQDIVSLEVYYTNEQSFSGKQKELWNTYYQNYQEIASYKIGYHIHFETTSSVIDKTILNPTDVESFFDYIQIYLYDDINQEDGWYDHITQEEVTENTLFTSIKLTASTKIADITSPITLTTFTYDNDDLDKNNNYLGNSKYQITINRK